MARDNFLIPVANVPIPDPPTGLRISRMRGQSIRVAWDEKTAKGHAAYRLYHSTDDLTYTRVLTIKGEIYPHLGLDPATHYYKVSALNESAMESDLSTAVSLTIADPIPYTTTSTVATAGDPVTIDLETALGRKATNGTLICTGPGVLIVDMSYDGGSTWTDPMELRPEDYFDLQDPDGHLELSHIRLDTDVSGTGYTLSIV